MPFNPFPPLNQNFPCRPTRLVNVKIVPGETPRDWVPGSEYPKYVTTRVSLSGITRTLVFNKEHEESITNPKTQEYSMIAKNVNQPTLAHTSVHITPPPSKFVPFEMLRQGDAFLSGSTVFVKYGTGRAIAVNSMFTSENEQTGVRDFSPSFEVRRITVMTVTPE